MQQQKTYDLEQSPLVNEQRDPAFTNQNYIQPVLYNSVSVGGYPTDDDNCCLGCCMGWLFGFFGLCCLCCVNDKASYLKGWLVPFFVWVIVLVVLVVLLVTGVLVVL